MDHPITAVAPHSPISEQNESQSPVPKEKSSEVSKITEPSNASHEQSNANYNKKKSDHSDFNLDEFLKSDNFPGVPGLLTVSLNLFNHVLFIIMPFTFCESQRYVLFRMVWVRTVVLARALVSGLNARALRSSSNNSNKISRIL